MPLLTSKQMTFIIIFGSASWHLLDLPLMDNQIKPLMSDIAAKVGCWPVTSPLNHMKQEILLSTAIQTNTEGHLSFQNSKIYFCLEKLEWDFSAMFGHLYCLGIPRICCLDQKGSLHIPVTHCFLCGNSLVRGTRPKTLNRLLSVPSQLIL